MSKKKERITFHDYYREMLGERWDELCKSFTQPVAGQGLQFSPELQTYHLDPASVYAARALPVIPGMRVLDMCAAPGGKSLVLASMLNGQGTLRCNELSAARRARLHRVLQECLPKEWQAVLEVRGADASRMGIMEKCQWDAILLDAPCSSERHLLQKDALLQQWSPARIRTLAMRQRALLASAADCLRPGGYLVYSTCALAPAENEEAVSWLLQRRPFMQIQNMDDLPGEKRSYGKALWPDQFQGMGPIYYCQMLRSM